MEENCSPGFQGDPESVGQGVALTVGASVSACSFPCLGFQKGAPGLKIMCFTVRPTTILLVIPGLLDTSSFYNGFLKFDF